MREVYKNTILLQETRKTSNRQPYFIPKTNGKKKKQNRITRGKEIIKIQAERNEKQIKETIVKINKTRSCFFEKINKMTSLPPDSSRKKERRIKSTKLEMKKER